MRLRQGRRHVRVLMSDPYADRSGLYARDIENAKKTLSKKVTAWTRVLDALVWGYSPYPWRPRAEMRVSTWCICSQLVELEEVWTRDGREQG